MVFFSKNLFKIITAILIIAFLIISPFPLFSKIHELNYKLNSEYNFNFSGVIELWNVDTFEGGSVSRTTFLEKRAIEFEKQNKGVFISINNLTLEQLKLNLQNNKKPHIITFGIGVEDIFLDEIINLTNTYNVRDDIIKSSTINGKVKALPIMMGGYSLIGNGEKVNDDLKDKIFAKIVYATTDNITPLLSLFINNLNPGNLTNENFDSFTDVEIVKIT